MVIKNQRGQTVVEYILLLSVAMSLVVTFYRSATFQRFFGSQGELGRAYKVDSEWGYRYASMSDIDRTTAEPNTPKPSAEEHASYYNKAKSQSHFFGPSDAYPQ
ncbi:MAG: hypothetical protein H0V66_16380 [Bdellovibrionales bacterium]|nr:hypothetical protein [Bdellovibrionales bacterium]